MAKKKPQNKAKKTLRVVKFAAVKKKAGGKSIARHLTAFRVAAAPAPALAATAHTVVVNNVRPEELDALLAELRNDPNVISTQVIAEGDGEFTVIVQYR